MVGRMSFAVGAVLALAGAVGLYAAGASTVGFYEVMAAPADAMPPPPGLATRASVVAGPVLFAIGTVLLVIGLGRVVRAQRMTTMGRALLAVAGVATLAAAIITAWGLSVQRECFTEMAISPVEPDFDRLGPRVRSAASIANIGWGCLIAAQAAILVAGLVLPKRSSETDEAPTPSKLGKWLLMATAFGGVSYGLILLLIRWKVVADLDMIARSMANPPPSMIADVVESMTTHLLKASLVLMLLGLCQIAVAAFVPETERPAD